MIRVLELESSRGWGGQERRTVRLTSNLNPDEFKFFFAAPEDSELYRRRKEIPGRFFPIPLRQSYDLVSLRRLIHHIRTHRIDVIATHSGKDGWLGALAGRITGTSVVRTRHLQTPVKNVISYNLSTRVVCVSDYVRHYLADTGVQREKLVTIHTGVDTKHFHPDRPPFLRRELGIGDDTVLIGIVAVLRQAKRHLDLIEAFSGLDADARLLIIGDGPQRSGIEQVVRERNLKDRVLMLGFRQDVPEILPSLDIFVLPSSMEALGTSILEASASGVPVVGSRVGGISECVIEGKTGLLFEAGNVGELQDRLSCLVSSPEQRASFGRAGRDFVERGYSLDRMVKNTAALYRELTARKTK